MIRITKEEDKMRKFSSLLLALVMTLALLVPTTWAAEKSNDLVVLYTNDVHCQVDQAKNKDTGVLTNIGYAGVAALKKQMQAEYNNVLLVDAGDHSHGGPIGTLSKGAYLVDIMNKTGYDYATVGNHEFDYGMPQLLTNIKAASYQYLSCNFARTDGTAIEGVKAYDIKDYNGLKVAFIGISTPESFTKSTPTYFQDANGNYIYTFSEGNNGQDLYNKVQANIDAAKNAGAEFVIAIAHLGTDPASSPWTSKDVIAHTSGLNVVLDGHSHSKIPSESVKDKSGTPVLLSSTGTKLAAIGKLVVNTTTKAATTELVTGYTTEDATTKTAISNIEAQFKTLLDTVVAHSNVALTIATPDGTKRAVRSAETNLGDLCADAYRVQMGADIGFVNGGGVRTDIAAGDITYGQIINVHPFGNMACLVEATGQQIVDALEMAARNYPNENGGFLQVSGLKYTINEGVKSTVKLDDKGNFISVSGARRVESVQVLDQATGKYAAIDLTKTYKLASHNYMLKQGGDGMTMFMKNKVLLDEVKLDNQILIDYIKTTLNGTVGTDYANLAGQGRISVIPCEHKGTTHIADAVAATCTAEGYTGNSVCDICGRVVTKGIATPVIAHTYVDGVCSVCGATSTYNVVSDAKTVTSVTVNGSKVVSLHIDGDLAKFVSVKMDGVLVDAENYTASEGSTIITFTPEYLKTLSPGKHMATVIFTDGTATAELTVISSPATGDSSNVAVYTILGLTALLGTGIVVGKKKELF